MDWDECEKLLVAIAKRGGSKHNGWYGETCDSLLAVNAKYRYTCFICHEEFATYPIHVTIYNKEHVMAESKIHGEKHLKERNLLVFL